MQDAAYSAKIIILDSYQCRANIAGLVRKPGVGRTLMTRVRNLLICVVLLGVIGVLHHKWLQMSGDSGIVTPASAATLSNGSLQTCSGTGTWHFVNPQNGGDCEPLTVDFTCDGNIVEKTATVRQCNTNTTNYNTIQTSGSCTLLAATNTSPGKVVLSDLFCVSATPTPTPTPTPSPTPTP
jgi:hypothetical protein